MKKKQIFKIFMLLKLPFTLYLVISLLIVPSIGTVSADVVSGAHRGASLDFEENTLEAFEKAVREPRYEFIEFDITYTEDDKILVFHQNTAYRVPKKLTFIKNSSLDEIREKFDFYIPEYHEAMNAIDGRKPVQIEIKSTGDFEKDQKLIEFVIEDCKNREILDKTLIASPNEDIIVYIEENYPEIKTGRVYWVTPYSIIPLEKTTSKFYEHSEADYILLHGYNLHNYDKLMETKPEDKHLVFWYFSDEMYIVEDERNCKFWEKA